MKKLVIMVCLSIIVFCTGSVYADSCNPESGNYYPYDFEVFTNSLDGQTYCKISTFNLTVSSQIFTVQMTQEELDILDSDFVLWYNEDTGVIEFYKEGVLLFVK